MQRIVECGCAIGDCALSEIIVDPNEPVRLQPREDGPVYLLRVPRVVDRATYRREVSAAGGRTWPQLTLIEEVKTVVERLLPGDENAADRDARLIELDAHADAIKAALEAWQQDHSDENAKALVDSLQPDERVSEIVEIVRRHDTGVARKIADNEVYPQIAGLVAARMFLRDWQGDGLPPFKRSAFGFDDALLDAIPTGDLVAIGQKIGSLLEPPETRLGNSASASSGPSSPTSSPDSKTAPAKGRLKATPGDSNSSAAAA